MIITKSIRRFENMHILMWLLKDTCWVLDYKAMGMFMVVPTLSLAFYLTWRMRQSTTKLLHNLAVCSWIMANSIWMTGEFFFDDSLRHYAFFFFLTGLLLIFYYYVFHFPKKEKKQPVTVQNPVASEPDHNNA
jgi:hypothetical protein